jgi:hypothetical protein
MAAEPADAQPLHNPKPLGQDWQTAAAKVVTVVLQPNVLQVAGFWAVGEGSSPLYYAVTLLFGLVVPLAVYVVYVKWLAKSGTERLGFDLARRHRLVPFVANILSLVALFVLVSKGYLQVAFTQTLFIYLWVMYLVVVNVACMVVTLFYKLSLHVAAAAALLMPLLYGDFGPYNEGGPGHWLLWIIVPGVIALVAWARYKLKAHDGLQLVAGFVVGAGCLPLLSLLGKL